MKSTVLFVLFEDFNIPLFKTIPLENIVYYLNLTSMFFLTTTTFFSEMQPTRSANYPYSSNNWMLGDVLGGG